MVLLLMMGASLGVDPVRGGPEVWSRLVDEKEKVVSATSNIFIWPEVFMEEKVV